MSIANGPVRFNRWLKKQPDNKIIGYRGEIKFNPISQYLQEKLGVDFGVTADLIFKYGEYDQRGNLPDWAINLNKRIAEGEPGTGIQARTVKKLIQEVTTEMKVAA